MFRFVASSSVRKPQTFDAFDPVYVGIIFLRNVPSTGHVHVVSTKRGDQRSHACTSGCLTLVLQAALRLYFRLSYACTSGYLTLVLQAVLRLYFRLSYDILGLDQQF